MQKIEYKSYIVNCDVIGQRHSYLTGKTQAEATQKAFDRAIAEGHTDAVVVGFNIHYNGGVVL